MLGYAETAGDPERGPVAAVEGALPEGSPDALGELGAALLVRPWKEEDELLPAPAAGEVGLAQGASQDARELAQDIVACVVAVPVVDLLEVVQVGDDEGERSDHAVGARDLVRERVLASATVRDSRQPVDERLTLDDRVQPRILEGDGGVRRERRRRHPVLSVERADEDETSEPLSANRERMLDAIAGRVLVSGGGGEAVTVDGGADGARRLDGGLDDDAEELLDVVRRCERLTDAGDRDP